MGDFRLPNNYLPTKFILMSEVQGPTQPMSIEIDETKYRQSGETFREKVSRVANTLADNSQHFVDFREILLDMRFLPAGRVQASVGSPRKTTAFNCFVSNTIHDSMVSIMDTASYAAQTMRLGGGIGYDFSGIRPREDIIVSLDSKASGPVSFMQIYDAVCKTVSSAGNRRGAQMGVLRVDHPDIEEFIESKSNTHNLTQFNISVGITDEFMRAVIAGKDFDLRFNDRVYKRVDANYLWDKIMRATWDWAEPGVLFIDRINEYNNLSYCEVIAATNPCGEQPLPPNGACLLGSFNLVRYVVPKMRVHKVTDEGLGPEFQEGWEFDWYQFNEDIVHIVRAMDNIFDKTTYPLKEQEVEAKSKRRMGLGVTGLANCGEAMGMPYGSPAFLTWTRKVLRTLANGAYQVSTLLAEEKGTFPLYDKEKYNEAPFIKRLSEATRALIEEHGTRNSHLLSIAPTGTISFAADNVSSGIEPVFHHTYERTVKGEYGEKKVIIEDYGHRVFGVKGKTADECTIQEHLDVLVAASRWVDSSVSKTLNVGEDVSWEDFKDIYLQAWKRHCKGCTTYRSAGERYGILNIITPEEGGACYINEETGEKTCG